jgi:hypothetical protein
MRMSLQNPVFIALFAIGLWVVTCFFISLLTGWFELGRTYRAAQPFDGTSWRFQDAQFRMLSHYNKVLTVGANSQGLSLAVFLPFRVGHPPLFIPWQDISVRPGKSWWFRVYKFEFRQAPSVYVQLREGLGKKIQIAAGSAWPGDRGVVGSAF